MSDLRRQLEELLSKPVQRPEDAERAAQAAEVLAEYLRVARRAEQVLRGDKTVSAPSSPKGRLSGLALEDAAERVLEEAGVALHARELGKRIKGRGWSHRRSTKPRPDLIMHQLAARLPRQPQRFRRVAPNTFALARWGEGDAESGRGPRLGLFTGQGGAVAREIGDHADEVARAQTWRSS